MNKELKDRIAAAARELHYIGEDNVISIYADYRDSSEFLYNKLYEERNFVDLDDEIREKIWDAYDDVIWEYENDILKKAGVYGNEFEEEAREYLRETFPIEPPYDHFLGEAIKVNIMLRTEEERNCEYTCIHDQYLAMVNPEALTFPDEALVADTMLSRLLKQQGHSLEELQATMKDYEAFFYDEDGCSKEMFNALGEKLSLSESLIEFNKTHNAFLTSVCQELENQTYEMGVITVLAKMSIQDFIEMQKGDREVTMPKDCMIGIYNPWNGSGSCLEIELEKELVFSTDLIRDVQIEGVKPQWEYTVDDAYGLIGSCWKEPKAIIEKAKGLDEVIKSCEEMSKKGESRSVERSVTNKEEHSL